VDREEQATRQDGMQGIESVRIFKVFPHPAGRSRIVPISQIHAKSVTIELYI
jgi:hypothetical protein